MHFMLRNWVQNFENQLITAKAIDSELGWRQASDHLAQLGVTSPVEGECMCLVEDWGQLGPLHKQHLEFNTMIWTTLQIHRAMTSIRTFALNDALRRYDAVYKREYALDLLEHFLTNNPDRRWVQAKHVRVFSPSPIILLTELSPE